MDRTINLEYTFKPISFEKINSEFSLMRCYVMALGKNRNYSHFSKESVEAALPSLFNIPVVCHLKKRDGGWYVGSHDRQVIIDDEGISVNDLTLPYGVVPESANPEFVEVTEKDGSKATYLVANIILWTGRYPDLLEAKSQTDNEVYYNESMEINISSYKDLKDDKKYADITDFIFSALCLLGRDLENPEFHTEPCFPSSRVEPLQFNLNDKFNNEFSLMLGELKKLTFNFEDKKSFSNEKEEKKNLNEKLELIAKYNMTVEELDFSIEDISLEDLELKLEEFSNGSNDESELSFSATYNQKREALRNALDSEITRDADGNVIDEVYFWVADASDEYCFVERSHWSANGDYESKYGRFTYSFDEATLTATITSEFEEMFLMWLTADQKAEIDATNATYAQLQSDFDQYKETYKTSETEVDELRTFKSIKLEAERSDAEKELFEKFDEKLAENADYLALKEKANEYDLETLEKECFAIFGKTTATFSLKTYVNAPIKITVDSTSISDVPYGGLIEKHTGK